MKRVLKWNVRVDDRAHRIGGGRVVHVGCQESADEVQVWTEEAGPVPGRAAIVFGTGQPIPDECEHLGSVVVPISSLVWHVYEVRS